MCCRCCTSLKVAGIWGSSIQMGLGSLLILQFLVLPENLGDYYFYYLGYICILPPLGALILLAVFKEVGWLLKVTSALFILLQLYGLSIRLMLPIDSTEPLRMLQRILTLFFAIVLTAVYSFVLILYSRKITPPPPSTPEPADGDGSAEAGGDMDDELNDATAL